MTSKTEMKPAAKRAARTEPRDGADTPARGRPKGGRKAEALAPYHHGALHEALLTAAERILERDGLVGLTLRAAAREAGVSHAAPTHHFGDLTGLLSELAAVGFRRFREALLAAAAAETGTGARLDAMGGAYVAFAKRYPGMFTLMFRSERLDLGRQVLAEAMDAAGAALAQAVGARRQETIAPEAPSLTQAADIVRAWAMVHGYAVLLLDGRLRHILAHLPRGADEDALLRAVLLPPAPVC
ncbi:WHG domain-containing protein [Bradyrhizobium sp. U87765 SZCCT0131]|uniref:TetR/AcrR family transcriptional regulator n=1 Tax=unclassified Bradyrhizobium TaxID=2631580 RepID=UPI001BA54A78|nr:MULTISPECIES: TetR/AcrR family transcriptional regulator [unclassified Bradyrhizobium]MBR1219846.1 WHG domain-containing protein [Bradyrhizobium sp. U87765 SZCCT0131]MBR1262497.1 WHG domain-containing protein [Bradyrhizobium sp. U87765 SZCCT0134]MBR1308320.1 WHG domain-containing protein [Bradyrhizobium sp. U87765 SZCCT0110]MBR1318279.1 WHG domain-containing protein [Bradyrhizobium sp. U87765 SZCCT0109]MBR1351982.1 WHG domain-containing protein [Bradyrhizobium sp. U87765 SZCCT0048]